MNFSESYFETPDFVFLIGIAGSGKSTWLKGQDLTGYVIVSPDEIRRELTGNISDQTVNGKVWAIAKERTIKYLNSGTSVILDATNVNTKNRKEFVKGLPTCNIKAKIFPADAEESFRRISADISKGVDRSNVPKFAVEKMYQQYLHTMSVIDQEGYEVIENL